MSQDPFLSGRDEFARELGAPDLYEFIDHFSIYAGVHTIANKLWTYEMLRKTVSVPGDIMEFGTWKGSNLMFLAKMNKVLEPFSPKRIIGFDNFAGLPAPAPEDGATAKQHVGAYKGNEKTLRDAIKLFELEKKVELVVGDALSTIPHYEKNNPQTVISFAYLDFDLYEPTKQALALIEKSLSVGGIVVFDQACTVEWPGETIAMKEFLDESSNKFAMINNDLSRQPTVALKRVE